MKSALERMLDTEMDVHIGRKTIAVLPAAADGISADNSILLYRALKRAGVKAELHVFAYGSHGFGLRPTKDPCSTWPDRCGEWLKNQGVLKVRERR
jgi:hypothetical protein